MFQNDEQNWELLEEFVSLQITQVSLEKLIIFSGVKSVYEIAI